MWSSRVVRVVLEVDARGNEKTVVNKYVAVIMRYFMLNAFERFAKLCVSIWHAK